MHNQTKTVPPNMARPVVLSIDNITKTYGGFQALKGISFSVEKGSVYGILGPNGSGKTTTLGIILDVLQHDGGSYTWFDNVPAAQARKRIGAILEQPNFYPYLNAVDNLKIVAQIKEIPYENIEAVLNMVSLWDRRNDPFKNYSLGMKQRLAVASAMLNGPDVLLLDEPTNGLDPQGIAEMREIIIKVASQGTTILLASHLLDEVEKVCTHVAVLKLGKILVSGRVDEVMSDDMLIEVSSDNLDVLVAALQQHPTIKKVAREIDRVVITPNGQMNAAELNQYLFGKDIVVNYLSVKKKSLEKQFLELTSN
jgi:ABC-2 type transport system ATP-binding protein